MSRFERSSHVIWHCQYHLVWVPKRGGYGRAEQRDDTKIRKIPRKGRNASTAAAIESRERSAFSEGALGVPPYGGLRCSSRDLI